MHASARHQALHHFVAKAEWSDTQMLRRVCQWVIPKMDQAVEVPAALRAIPQEKQDRWFPPAGDDAEEMMRSVGVEPEAGIAVFRGCRYRSVPLQRQPVGERGR